MIDRADFIGVVNSLESCLTLWREEGVRSVDAQPETVRALAPPGAPAPRATGPAAPPVHAPRPAPAVANTPPPAPAPAAPPRPPRPAGAPCSRILAERLPELNDTTPRAQTRLLVVSESASFLGAAGELLEKMLGAAGYRMLDTPAPLSDPHPPAAAALLVLGQAALQALKPESLFNMVRGKWTRIGDQQAMVSYDPVYLGRMPSYKAMTWEDLQKLLEKFSLAVPPRPKKT